MFSKNGGKVILLDRWINHPDGRFRPVFQNKPVGMAPLLWIYRGQLKHPKKGFGIICHWLCMLFPMRALFPWHTTIFFSFTFFTPAFGSHNTKWKAYNFHKTSSCTCLLEVLTISPVGSYVEAMLLISDIVAWMNLPLLKGQFICHLDVMKSLAAVKLNNHPKPISHTAKLRSEEVGFLCAQKV